MFQRGAKNTLNTSKAICPSQKDWDFDEKSLHWASVVRASYKSTIMKKKQEKSSFKFSLDFEFVYIFNITWARVNQN